jgi:hypothetical protein
VWFRRECSKFSKERRQIIAVFYLGASFIPLVVDLDELEIVNGFAATLDGAAVDSQALSQLADAGWRIAQIPGDLHELEHEHSLQMR